MEILRSYSLLVFAVFLSPTVAYQATANPAFQTAPVQQQVHHHDFWHKPRTPAEVKAHVQNCLAQVDYDTSSGSLASSKSEVEVISAEPPLVVVHNFISTSKCDDIIETAKSRDMMRSTIGSTQSTSSIRTSSTVWLRDEDCAEPLRLIAEKVSSISGLPPTNMENLQVVRYQEGQQFEVHTDHQDSFNDLERRGRLATCLVYLNEPEQGGETWFPGLEELHQAHGNYYGQRITVTPRRGSAIFFWNTIEKPGCYGYTPDMFLNTDLRMKHAGLPVTGGEKWVCNRWVHPIDFQAGVRGF